MVFVSCQNKTEGVIMVSPQQVQEAIKKGKDIQLLDVRTPNEYSVSHLKEAQNICITNDDFKEKAALLDKEKLKTTPHD